MPYRALFLSGSVNLWGARRSLLDFLSKIDRERISPLVVCSKKGPLTEELRRSEIPFRLINLPLWRKAKNFSKIPGTLLPLYRLIREEKIDFIHSNSHWDNPYGVLAGKMAHIPTICHLRDIVSRDKVRKYLVGWADKVIAISYASAEVIEGRLKRKVEVIYNGINLSVFSPRGEKEVLEFKRNLGLNEKELIIGTVGQISELKGQEYLIQAMPYILERFPHARIILCGEVRREKDEGRVEAMVRRLNLMGKIIMLGWQDNLSLLYSSLDVFVLPTLKEAFGRVVAEAMACKVPVVASRIGGVPEVVEEGKTGLLFSPGDYRELARCVIELLGEENNRKRMGEEGRKRVKSRFNLDEQVKKIEKVYDGLL